MNFAVSLCLVSLWFFKARNAEKAMTALARWRRMKEEEEKGPVAKRPNDVSECTTLSKGLMSPLN